MRFVSSPVFSTAQATFATLVLSTAGMVAMVFTCVPAGTAPMHFWYVSFPLEIVCYIALVALTEEKWRMNWFWTKNLAQLIEEDLWDRADYSSSWWGDAKLVGKVEANRASIINFNHPQYLPPREKVLADCEPAFRAWADSADPPEFLAREDVLARLGEDEYGYPALFEHAKRAAEKIKAKQEAREAASFDVRERTKEEAGEEAAEVEAEEEANAEENSKSSSKVNAEEKAGEESVGVEPEQAQANAKAETETARTAAQE